MHAVVSEQDEKREQQIRARGRERALAGRRAEHDGDGIQERDEDE